MTQMRLCDADRKRFGVEEEWVEFDPLDISVNELDMLAERFGFDPMDWPVPFRGELSIEQAGDPEAVPKPPRWQAQVGAWMLLRQAGKDVTLEEAGEVRWFKVRTRASLGKEPDLSPSSEASTTVPSPSFSA